MRNSRVAATKSAVEDHGETGLGTGLEVDGRAGEGTAGRIGLEEGSADVGQALADQFLVGVDALFGLAGHGFGHGDRLHEGHQGNDQGRGQQLQHGIEAERGQAKRGQAGGDLADDIATADELNFALFDLFDMPLRPSVSTPSGTLSA